MKKRRNNSDRASTLQIALSAGLISIFAILFVVAAPANRKEAPRQDLSGSQLEEGADSLGNYPDASILLSTDTTVTPDAVPTNTTSINVSTSTNFKGKLEGYPATGLVRVTDAHPAGTYTVTVRAFNGGGQTATRTFTLTVTTTICIPMLFTGATNFGTGTGTTPHSVTVGDFNGDGKQDLAFASQGSPFVSIVLGDGAGSFGPATNFSAGNAESLAVGDFNGDGKQDLVTGNISSDDVSILLGDGTGNFSVPTNFGAGDRPSYVAVGDFNGDGKQDLAAVNSNSFNVSILLGDGAGNFSAPTNFGVGRYPYWAAVGDFNGDGKQDLAVTNSDSNTVSILLGDGTGNFSTAINFGTGGIPESVAVGDFNGDGKQDLAVANGSSNTVSILLGNGAGNFSARTDFFAGGDEPKFVAVGDFNGDGKQDLAVANYISNRLSLLFGSGTGSFGSPTNFAAGLRADSVAVGDFNGDGKQDLAVANGAAGNVSIVMRQQCPAPTPTPTPTATATATATASPTPTATATGTPLPTPVLGNYPDASIPLSTDTTVTPDAPPTNTTTITVSTSTNFQGRLEGDPTTGVVRVTDAHPAGTYIVTVRAFNGGGPVAIATRTFTLTVTTPATCSPLSFAAVNFCAGNFNAGTAVVGDFNGDGKQDLATAYYTSAGFVSILLGDGAGHFSAPANFSVGAYPGSPALGDFNGDGRQDLVVPTNSGVSILLGDGTGNFNLLPTFGPGSNFVAVGDFNGDGKQDLASANRSSNNVSIFLGDGAGGFSAPTTFGDSSGAIAVGDFNSDGKQDLAVINSSANGVSILFGDGTGGFSVPIHFAALPSPSSVRLGDFNGDGKQDLVVIGYGSSMLAILLGDGTGYFSVATTFGGNAPHSVAVGDFNGDGKQDLAVGNYGGSAGISIFVGDGTGNFSGPTNFSSGGDPYSVAVGDFNGDGMQDIAVGQYSATVTVLFRSCPGGTPTPTPTATATGTPPPPPTLGNYPDRSIPLSTDTTVLPDATPSNTTSINVSTSTNFQGTLQGDPATGAVRVTDAHPAGTYLVTVRALNPGAPTATKTFILTVTTPVTCTPLSFALGGLDFGYASESVAVGDFNGDGKQDLVAVSYNAGSVSILLGDGTGNFSAATAFAVGFPLLSVAVGDFNGDGKQDLATANYGSCTGTVSVLLGDGTGHFSGPATFTNVANIFPHSVVAGDFNGDGKQDLATANTSNNVSVFLGDGAGSFSFPRNFSAGTTPRSVALGDFNSDGKQDLAIANYGSSSVSILLGDGAGNFSSPTNLAAGTFPYSIAVGDFNADGKQDLAVANNASNNVSIFLGNGMGNFSAATNFLADCGPYSVAVGDFNGDGKQDLSVASNGCNGTGNTSILLGDGAGNFGSPTTFATGNGSRSVAVGDFNGDSKQDLVVANGASSGSILRRSCAPTPTATPTATATVSPCPPVITQSTSQAITSTVDPCRYGPTGGFVQTQNSYWRAFNMGAFVGGAQYNVNSVSFGMYAVGYSTPPSLSVRLYANIGAPFPGGTRTLIGSSTTIVGSGQGGTVVTVPLMATVPAGTPEMVMELFTPDGLANHYTFNVGGNTLPETGLSYWSSGCVGNNTPQVISSHLVFNIYGTCAAPPPSPTPTATPSPTATACGTLLYDQTNSAGTGTVSQNFEAANDAFDSRAADDFVVRAGSVWTIQRVNVNGVYFNGPGPAASVNVTFYFNSGTLPGAAVPGGTYTNLAMTDTAGNFSIPLPTNLVLSPGTYWVSVQANMDFTPGGEWGWLDRTVASNSPAAWQNPGGGFGFGCLTWGARAATCGVDPAAPDQIFQILGCLGAPSPTPTPSATPTPTLTPTPSPTPSPGICGTLLYDQTSSAGTATVSQNFEAANDGFDTQLADDFVVPAGPGWTIQRINVNGVYFSGPGPAASVNVAFYFNSGSLPGAAVPGGTYMNLPMTDTAGNFSIPLPANLVLSPGTYWVSVQANMDFTPGGEWGWVDRTVTSNSPAAWQNPGGGFGFGCLTWGARAATCGVDPTAPDQIFQIVGCLGAPSPTPSPTPTPCPLFDVSGTVGQCTTAGPSGIALAGVTITRTVSGGGGDGSTTTDQNGNYFLSGFSCVTNTFTPSKAARLPGSAGINTTDVIAVQRHFLNLGTPLTGCRLAAADVNGDASINTLDVIAIQRFFLGQTTGTANVGKYQFTPANRTYTGGSGNQTGQNFDTIVFGDVTSPFAAP